MQWIFMLIGLAFGAGIDESVTGALLGGLMGLGLGQAIRLQWLARENAELRKVLGHLRNVIDRTLGGD